VRQELVAQALACSASHEPGDVDELDRRGTIFFRVHDAGKHGEPRIEHRHDADVRIDVQNG